MSPERRWWIPALLLLLVVFAVYLPVARAGYVWDDDEYVALNTTLRDSAGLVKIWFEPKSSPQYYPLVFTSFWVERAIFGMSPAVHHLVNVGFHALNVLLLWLVLKRLRVPGALAIAFLFAVHPVHVESVAWMTERKNVLSGFFALASLLAYLHAAFDGADEETTASRRRLFYVLSLGLFVCALLSKTVTATLPAVLVLLLWWKQGRVERRQLIGLLPMFALGIGFGIATAWIEVHHVGAAGEEWTLPVLGHVILAGRAIWFYVGKLLWPHPVTFSYAQWSIDPGAWWQYLFPLGAIAAVAALWRWRGQLGRGPLVAALCFVGTLVPVLGFLNVYPMRYSYVADHFQYLPSIAFIALAVTAAAALLERVRLQRLGLPLAAVLVIVLGVVARAETAKFRDLESLWQDTIDKNPQSWLARNNRGNLRMKEGRFTEAASDFEAAVSARPDLAEGYNNLGTALFYAGETDRAIQNHREAVRLKPGYAEALNNLGVELAAEGRDGEATGFYRQALEARHDYPMARFNLANALARLGEGVAAEAEYREVIRIDPNFAMAYYNLGLRLLGQGKRAEAGPLLGEAFRLKPNFPVGYYQVGNLLLQQGDPAAATDSYARALQQKPDYPEACSNLGVALMRQGRLGEAIASFREAVRLNPDYAIAENNLGSALEQQGEVSEAAAHYEAAVRIDPTNANAAANLERVRGRAAGRRPAAAPAAGGK